MPRILRFCLFSPVLKKVRFNPGQATCSPYIADICTTTQECASAPYVRRCFGLPSDLYSAPLLMLSLCAYFYGSTVFRVRQRQFCIILCMHDCSGGVYWAWPLMMPVIFSPRTELRNQIRPHGARHLSARFLSQRDNIVDQWL